MHTLTRAQTAAAWAAQIVVAVILLQTLFFKFTAAEESVYIFSAIHAEPWGRIGSGVIELFASLLLLYPPLAAIGAALALASMAGAILTHLAVLGIEVQGDGGLLFALAVTALAGSVVVLLVRRAQLPMVGRYFEMA
jgi:ABC-type Fe3+-siderophore transport system permease subunit